MEKWTYAVLLALSILIPFIRSFEKRVAFYSHWKHLFMGILVMMLLYIPWDIYFTRLQVWSFNYNYVLGFYFFDLPIEEWLFFIIITYCCVFIYEVVRYFFPRFHHPLTVKFLTFVLGTITLFIALFNTDRIYTFTAMYLASVMLFWQLFIKSHRRWLSHFYLMYFIALIPFFIVNGVLTSLPVVSYNNTHNLGIRLGTIPVEDAFYFLSMMFITILVYEQLRSGKVHQGHKSKK